MPSVNYTHSPNETVWVLLESPDCAVRIEHGTVIRVRIEVLITETKLFYDIRLDGEAGTIEREGEADVFAQGNLAGAMAEYELRLLSP